MGGPVSRWLVVRRPLDRLAGAVLLILVAPVLLVLSRRVARADPGPGVVTVERVGRGGQSFAMRKLRTMRAAGPSGRATGAPITASADPRVTSLGRRLRRRHLDELPQLVNVARGDMTLLGPRPETPELVDNRDHLWASVLRVPPGIAGPTQLLVDEWEATLLTGGDAVESYGRVVLPVKLAVDTWYVEHATPWIDVLVVVSMLQRALFGRPTTAIERRVRRDVPEAAEVPPGRPRRRAEPPTGLAARAQARG